MVKSTSRMRALRMYITDLQGGKCCYCRKPLYTRGETRTEFAERIDMPKSEVNCEHYRPTVEHLKRKADGGTNARHNLAVACTKCNSSRGTMNWLEYATRVTGEWV